MQPQISKPYKANADTYVIPLFFPIPMLGALPINAYLIKAKEPVLVDTSAPVVREQFLSALKSLIDPKDLKWLFMTHEDGEHGGNVKAVLDNFPNARLVTNFVGVGKLSAEFEVPLPRVYLLNHGQSFSAGDRHLTALRPPLFDSAATQGLYDAKTSSIFTVDSFGAFLPSPTEDPFTVPQPDFIRGFNTWNNSNHPWSVNVDQKKFASLLEGIRKLNVKTILSTHLPPAHGHTEELLKAMANIPNVEPFVGPDQAALQAMLAQMAAGATSHG
ncbi:MAG: MBL fold metallo-hydrolase [SAR202 cluster bacterium]|nr:MBL fold metallo-hydrolase [SAR202 cluster bacterium]